MEDALTYFGRILRQRAHKFVKAYLPFQPLFCLSCIWGCYVFETKLRDVALLGDSALGIICQSENVPRPPLLLFYRTEGRQISLPAADDGDAAESFFRPRRSSKVKGGWGGGGGGKASCHPWSDNETKPVNHNAALPPLLQRAGFLERQTPLKGTMIAGVGCATVLSFSFT